MATFITNIKFTQQGIKGIDETTKRAAALKVSAKKMGVKIDSMKFLANEQLDKSISIANKLERNSGLVEEARGSLNQLSDQLSIKNKFLTDAIAELQTLTKTDNTEEQNKGYNDLQVKLKNAQTDNTKNLSILQNFVRLYGQSDAKSYTALLKQLLAIGKE